MTKINIGNVFLLIIVFICFMFAGHIVRPPDIRPDNLSQIQESFQTERAVSRLAYILGDEIPHPVDSPENDQVRLRLLDQIKAMGYIPQVRDDISCLSKSFQVSSCARV